MKGINFCGECGYYSYKLHKCTNGAINEGSAKDPFYADCPLVDAVPVVRCKDCKHYQKTQACRYHSENELPFGFDVFMCPNDFCSYGERKEDV